MPFPAVRAATAAQLVVFPAGAVVSQYVGTGAAAYVSSALAGVACAAAATAAAGRVAGEARPARGAGLVALLAIGYAALAVALAFRLVPGGADPAPVSRASALMYGCAAGAAAAWTLSGRRR